MLTIDTKYKPFFVYIILILGQYTVFLHLLREEIIVLLIRLHIVCLLTINIDIL